MDFKIGDEIEDVENGGVKKNKNDKLPLIIIIAVALVSGLVVFFITNALFGKKEPPKEEAPKAQVLSLTEDNVQILYNYVTYGVKNTRGDKFLKEKNVTLDSFTNEEKFYYALQFADVEDFEATGKLNENNKKTYLISNSKIRSYMQRFFGTTVTYTTDDVIKYPFSFRINGQNVGIMTYSEVDEGFITVFDGYEQDEESTGLIEPYYTSLVKAVKELDGSYTLVEKVIYTKVEKQDDNTYNISIYKDYENTQLLETKTNVSEDDLKDEVISIEKYKDNASTITYRFKLSGNILCFNSSTITTN